MRGRKVIFRSSEQTAMTQDVNDCGVAILLDKVSYSREGNRIFDQLSLTLTERRIGLIGRNGSGKSTLSRLICGLVPADEGSITVAGTDIYNDRQAAINTIGLIFQNPDHQIIFPTVEEEVAFGLESLLGDKKEAIAKAKDFLARFGKSHWAEKSTFALSQGQRHLVCLMAVLAMEPKTILLDEPFAGLDWPTSHRLFAWLEKLDQQLVLVTHDIEQVRAFDRIIWLEEGRVAMDDKPEIVVPAYLAAMRALAEEEDGGLDFESPALKHGEAR